MLDMEPNENPLFGAANGTAANESAPELARTDQTFEEEARSPQKPPKDWTWISQPKPSKGPVTPNGPPPELLSQSEGGTTFEEERQENKSPRGKPQENLSGQVAWMAGGILIVVLIWWMLVGGSW